MVAGAVDQQDVAGAELTEGVVHDGAVGAGAAQGDGGAGDAGELPQGADGRVDEAEFQEMADGGWFGAGQEGDQLGVDAGGEFVEDEHGQDSG